jgi:hypothetical protein
MEDTKAGSITTLQIMILRHLCPRKDFQHLSSEEATRLINSVEPYARWRRHRASPKQESWLLAKGLWQDGLTKGEASILIAITIRRERWERRLLGREYVFDDLV